MKKIKNRFLILGAVLSVSLLNSSWRTSSFYFVPEENDVLGILTPRDIEIRDQYTPRPYVDDDASSFGHYWQCLPVQNISIECELNPDPSDPEEPNAMGMLTVKDQGLVHSYQMRRLLPADGCEYHVGMWRDVIKDQSHICIFGAYLGHQLGEITWEIERIRSSCGYWNYFTDHENKHILEGVVTSP